MMLWRILMSKLFGWEYAAFRFAYGHEIGRVRTTKCGVKYCMCCGKMITEKTPGREWMIIL